MLRRGFRGGEEAGRRTGGVWLLFIFLFVGGVGMDGWMDGWWGLFLSSLFCHIFVDAAPLPPVSISRSDARSVRSLSVWCFFPVVCWSRSALDPRRRSCDVAPATPRVSPQSTSKKGLHPFVVVFVAAGAGLEGVLVPGTHALLPGRLSEVLPLHGHGKRRGGFSGSAGVHAGRIQSRTHRRSAPSVSRGLDGSCTEGSSSFSLRCFALIIVDMSVFRPGFGSDRGADRCSLRVLDRYRECTPRPGSCEKPAIVVPRLR